MILTALNKLMLREDLSPAEIEGVLQTEIDETDAVQIGAILALLHAKGETVQELAALVEILKKHCIKVKGVSGVVDIVGTGGDKANTVNISTGASLLAASCGARIAKHGNRAVSSQCGSADVIEKLGIPLLESSSEVERMISETNYGFMFAPFFHPLLKQLAPIRKRLGIRTTLNLIGPLVNPADVDHILLGVYRGDLMLMYAKLLAEVGLKRSLVVHGHGTDELTSIGPSKAFLVDEGQISVQTIDPKRYGMQPCHLEDLKGGDVEKNAHLLEQAFLGKQGPVSDTLCLNAGAALFLAGVTDSLSEGISQAQEQQRSGKVTEFIDFIRGYTHELP